MSQRAMWTYVWVFVAIGAVALAVVIVAPAPLQRWALVTMAVMVTALLVVEWAHALSSRYRGVRRLRAADAPSDAQTSQRSTSALGAEKQPAFRSREVVLGLVSSVAVIAYMAWMIKDSFSR